MMNERPWIKLVAALLALGLMATLVACGPSATTTSALPPAPTSEPGLTGSPAPEQTGEPTIWALYRDETRWFSFEYPAAYDEAPYLASCGIKEEGNGLRLGLRTALHFFETGGLSLGEFEGELLADNDWTVESQTASTINGLEAITVEYRFGGTNRFGTFTLLQRGGYFYLFEFSAGGFCEIPGSPLSEPEAYAHMIESFQFEATSPLN